MTDRTGDVGNDAGLVELEVADPPEAWAAAGFTVADDGTIALGSVAIRLVGRPDGERAGIRSWTLAGLVAPEGTFDLDGLPTHHVAPSPNFVQLRGAPPKDCTKLGETAGHGNGCVGVDHVVVATPDLERTIGALEAVGLGCRRIREAGTAEHPMRQAFFRLGPTILEVVGGAPGTGSGRPATEDPARWFGLALDVADLDATAAVLGDGLGRIKPAVQAGRRIATVRHQEFGMSVAVAAMDDHGDR